MKHVLDKFRHKLPKDELKRLGKEIAKKLVASDYKNNRVSDPTAALGEKQASKIRKHVRDFLDRAVEKYQEHQRRKDERDGEKPRGAEDGPGSQSIPVKDPSFDSAVESPFAKGTPEIPDDRPDGSLSEPEGGTPPGSLERKRKRDEEGILSRCVTPCDEPDAKRLRETEDFEPTPSPPPPPPPPPPEASMESTMEDEDRALREQEEALMRENEESQRLEDEAAKTRRLEQTTREMHENLAKAASDVQNASIGGQALAKLNGSSVPGGSFPIEEHDQQQKEELLSH